MKKALKIIGAVFLLIAFCLVLNALFMLVQMIHGQIAYDPSRMLLPAFVSAAIALSGGVILFFS